MPVPIVFPLLRHKPQLPGMMGSRPQTPQILRIYGVTKDSTGTPITSCVVDLFRSFDNMFVDQVISDGSGNYEFRSPSLSTTYYVVAYKAGSPDTAGTTINTLVGT